MENKRENGKMNVDRERYFRANGLQMDKVRGMHKEARKVYEMVRKIVMEREKATGEERIRRSRFNGNYDDELC